MNKNIIIQNCGLFLLLSLLAAPKLRASCFDIDEGTAYKMGLSKKHLEESLKELVEADQLVKNGKGGAELKRRLEHSQRVLWAHVRGRHSAEEIQRVESMVAKFNEYQKGQITLFRFVMQDIGRLALKENISKGLAPPIESVRGVGNGISQEYIQYANVQRGKKTSDLLEFERIIGLLERAGFDTIHVEPHYPFGADQGYSVKNEKITNPDLAPPGRDADQVFDAVRGRHKKMNWLIDFVPSHVDKDHRIVRKALAGDKIAQDRIVSIKEADLISADRYTTESGEVMVRYKTRQGDQVLVTERGLEFSGMRDVHVILRDGTYYHHSFTPQQFDLVGHHELNILMTFEFINHWVGKGIYGIRADAVPFWFKPWGTSGKHEAQSRYINEFYLDFLRGVNPKAEWVPEVVAGNEIANQYAGHSVEISGKKTGSGATVINNFEMGILLLQSVATGDASPLKTYFYGRRKNLRLPEGTRENYVISKHDQHDLGFLPGQYRKQFQDLLWQVGGGVSADGWSGGGRIADIMKGDVRKIGALLELGAGLPGSINLLQGDMLGVRSNWPYQWQEAAIRLNQMNENNLLKPGEYSNLSNLLSQQPKNKPPVSKEIWKIVDIRDVHRGPVSSELVEAAYNGNNQVFERVKDILPAKSQSRALNSLTAEIMIEPVEHNAEIGSTTVSYIREAKGPDGRVERVLVVANLGNKARDLTYQTGTSGNLFELKGAPAQMSSTGGGVRVSVPPSTCYWIRL